MLRRPFSLSRNRIWSGFAENDEMTLQEPEIMEKAVNSASGLRARSPSLHLIRVDIQTEVSPVVGTEQQSEEMLRYFMDGV